MNCIPEINIYIAALFIAPAAAAFIAVVWNLGFEAGVRASMTTVHKDGHVETAGRVELKQ